MLVPETPLAADHVLTIFKDLLAKLLDLPAGQRKQIEGDLEKLQTALGELAEIEKQNHQRAGQAPPANDAGDRDRAEKAIQEALKRAEWMARFPDENPNPVARISLEGEILYCNRASADPAVWGFATGQIISQPFQPLLAEISHQSAELKRDLQMGERYYSITMMPFPDEHYINVYGLEITERKLAELERRRNTEALRESEERFRTMADGTPVLIWVADPQGSIAFINRAFAEFFAVTIDQVRAGSWQMLVHPEDTNRFLHAYTDSFRERRPFQTRGRVRRHDGQWRWFDSYAQPRFSETGEYLGLVGSSLDITERVQAEEALKQSYSELINERSRLLAVMEALPVGISIQDRDGAVVQVNKGYEEVWGSPLPQANSVADYGVYQAWWMDTGLPLLPEEWASAAAVQKGETVSGQFLEIQRFDGRRAYVLNSGAPIRNAAGEITGSAVAILDISRLIEAENALQASQEQLRVALRSVPLMVYTCDRELRYTAMYNPLLGLRPEEVIGKRDEELVPREAVADIIAAKQTAIDTGQGQVQEVKATIDGETTYYILATEPIRDKQGAVTGLTCSAIDITHQKQLEAEQQEQAIQIEVQRRLMDQREKDRYAIARDIHDGPIQTLSSLMFNLHMVKEAFPDPALTTELKQFALDIKNTIHELREVLNELRPPALIHFGFSKVVRMYVEDLQARFNHIQIELDLAEGDRVLSNEVHLTLFRIFQAAINNVIQHSDASDVRVTFKIEPDCFLLEIHDHGRGFDSKNDYTHLTRIGHFGLAGMKERAEAIGGEFSVTSSPGQGTRIVVKGPINGNTLK